MLASLEVARRHPDSQLTCYTLGCPRVGAWLDWVAAVGVDAQAPWAEPFLACGSHARCTQQAAGVGSQPSCPSALWALHANPHRAAPVPAVPAVPAVLKVGNSAFADEFNELPLAC